MPSPVAQVCLYGSRETGYAYLASGPALSSPILAQGGWSAADESRPSGEHRTLTEVIARAKADLRAHGIHRGELLVCFPGGAQCARTRVEAFESVGKMSLEPAPVVVLTADTIENAARQVAKSAPRSGGSGEAPLGWTSSGKPVPRVPAHLGALEKAASEAGPLFDDRAAPAIRAAQVAARAHFEAYAEGFTLADHREAERLLREAPLERDRYLRYARNGLVMLHERAADAIEARTRRELGP